MLLSIPHLRPTREQSKSPGMASVGKAGTWPPALPERRDPELLSRDGAAASGIQRLAEKDKEKSTGSGSGTRDTGRDTRTGHGDNTQEAQPGAQSRPCTLGNSQGELEIPMDPNPTDPPAPNPKGFPLPAQWSWSGNGFSQDPTAVPAWGVLPAQEGIPEPLEATGISWNHCWERRRESLDPDFPAVASGDFLGGCGWSRIPFPPFLGSFPTFPGVFPPSWDLSH